jgi:cysteine synthase A
MKHDAIPQIAPNLHPSILDTIGNTPIVRINRLAPAHVDLYVKIEAFNPGGSIKDRFALAAIEAAEASGALKPGQTVVEATSGNTGIGLALVCAAKGYPLVVTMAESFSVERRRLMRFLGAKVVLTPAAQKGTGMLAKAEELAREHGWFLARQFENEANADMHSRTTAREIIDAFCGQGPDFWVTGFGTGGTLKGVSRVLRAECPKTRIVLTEPDNMPMLQSGIPQQHDAEGRPISHPTFRPHLMQGWSPDFIAKLAEDATRAGAIDTFQPVSGNDALAAARDLAAKEGIFCGISGGATFAAALGIAETAPPGSRILAMLPDTGERYMSTVLFDEIGADMDDEERALSHSTPGFRFDAPPPVPAPTATPAAPACTPEAAQMIDDIVAAHPVVLFVLEWCEFSWSVRKLFAAAGVPCHAVELDAAAMQKDNLGGSLRAAVGVRAGAPTIPQIFVGGDHIGGATETFDAVTDGSMAERLAALGLTFDASKTADPYQYLPTWMHPR